MAPLILKGLINTILDITFTNRFEGIDGFPNHHPNLNNNNLSLLENIVKGILHIKMHPTPF
jgi:hypothetical protein